MVGGEKKALPVSTRPLPGSRPKLLTVSKQPVLNSGNVAGIAGTVTRTLVLSASDVVKARGRWKHGITLALQLPISDVTACAAFLSRQETSLSRRSQRTRIGSRA